MNTVGVLVRFLAAALAVFFWPATSSAQMGMESLNSGMGGGFFDPSSRYSGETISSGFSGATYTPFERLRYELRTTRKHAVQTPQEGDKAGAGKPAADKIDTEEVDVQETAFRARTERTFPQPSLAVATKTFEPIYLSADSPRKQRIRKKLNEPAKAMEFTEIPLRDVAAEIEDLHEIPVQIDAKACEDAGLELDAPITRSVHDVSLRSALRLLLGDLDMTYVVTNDVLMITTKDKAAEDLAVVLYPVTWGYTPASLIDVVHNTIAPQTWATVGGPGAVLPAGRFLCVSQTEEVHYEIKHFLERLCESEFLQSESGEAAEKQRIITRIHPVTDPKVLGDLGVKLAGMCNAALGSDGDASAKVTVVGDRLVVQSSSRPFHVYAADVVAAFNGIDVLSVERFQSTPPPARRNQGIGMGGGAF